MEGLGQRVVAVHDLLDLLSRFRSPRANGNRISMRFLVKSPVEHSFVLQWVSGYVVAPKIIAKPRWPAVVVPSCVRRRPMSAEAFGAKLDTFGNLKVNVYPAITVLIRKLVFVV